MNPEEGVHKVCPMRQIHIDVPRRTDRREHEQPRWQGNASKRAQIAPHGEVDEDHEPRQEKADRPLRQHAEPRTRVGEIEIAAPPFPIAEVERAERPAEEHEERQIGQDEFGEESIEHARAENDHRPERRPRIIEPPRERVGEEQSRRCKERREKSCGKVRHTEDGERSDQFPVEEDGFIVPVVSVDLRREIIPRREHLLCRLRIVHLDGCRHGECCISPEKKGGEKEQHRPQPHPIIHRAPPFPPPVACCHTQSGRAGDP